MLQGAIFDIDGTLLDSVDFHAAAWQDAFRHFGKRIPYMAIREQVGKGADQLMPEFLSPLELAKYGTALEKYRGVIFRKQYLPLVQPFSGVRKLFQRLHRDGIKVTLASSAKKDELKEYRRIAEIEDLVEAGASSEDASRSKPNPDIFQFAMAELGSDIQSSEVRVIGDSPWDAAGATRAGLKAIGVLCGGFPAAILQKAGYSGLFRGPADLLIHYNSWVRAETKENE